MHKILGRAVAAGWGEVTRYLIAPRSIERMLGNRQELHVRISHVEYVVRKLFGKFTVR
ncbi:hypothetical protein HRbin30_02979 [bacterium HR30]|nr:hypothetical protein HRbin30_02979 [bacterium HR30]